METKRRGRRGRAAYGVRENQAIDHTKEIELHRTELFLEGEWNGYTTEKIEQLMNTRRSEYLVKVFSENFKEGEGYQFKVEATPSGKKIKQFGSVEPFTLEEAEVEEAEQAEETPPKRGRGSKQKKTTAKEPTSIETYAVVESTMSTLAPEDKLAMTGMQIADGIKTLLGIIEEEGDDEGLQEQLDLFTANLAAKSTSYIHALSILNKEEETIKSMKAQFEGALKSKRNSKEKLRKFIGMVMEHVGTRKVSTDLGSIFFTEKKGLNVYDSEQVPNEYKLVSIPVKIPCDMQEEIVKFIESKGGTTGTAKVTLDETKAIEDVWNGKTIPGASKDYKRTLTVKNKKEKEA